MKGFFFLCMVLTLCLGKDINMGRGHLSYKNMAKSNLALFNDWSNGKINIIDIESVDGQIIRDLKHLMVEISKKEYPDGNSIVPVGQPQWLYWGLNKGYGSHLDGVTLDRETNKRESSIGVLQDSGALSPTNLTVRRFRSVTTSVKKPLFSFLCTFLQNKHGLSNHGEFVQLATIVTSGIYNLYLLNNRKWSDEFWVKRWNKLYSDIFKPVIGTPVLKVKYSTVKLNSSSNKATQPAIHSKLVYLL